VVLKAEPAAFFDEQSPKPHVKATFKIISVDVKAGDTVEEGDVICLLESMKMENPILAPVGGTIAQIGVSADQTVKPGDVIAVIEY
jgi:biotin carboxyl carrier protein